MAKFDTYEFETSSGSDGNTRGRKLSVLFENGDDIEAVIARTDSLLQEVEPTLPPSLEDQLVALTPEETIELMIRVWSIQMQVLGNQKYNYANDLRQAINEAQSA